MEDSKSQRNKIQGLKTPAGTIPLQTLKELSDNSFEVEKVKAQFRIKSPLKEVWGKWPGEESIGELLAALNDISKEN